MAASAPKYRSCFKISIEKVNWYPGHMNHGFKHMQAVVRNVDCIIEVHDARIPFTGRNPKFLWGVIGPKPHILVLNKKDLISEKVKKLVKHKYNEENCENIVFTNCLDTSCKGLSKIIPLAAELIKERESGPKLNSNYKMMVIGVPNVGKSSLINALRNRALGRGKATRVGPQAGVTRSILNEIKVWSMPPMYLVDTPGILTPNIKDVECGMKLALCSCLNDEVVGVTSIADFILYWMNKTENFTYVDLFGLSQPVDDIFPLLVKIAVDKKLSTKKKNIVNNSVEVVPDVHSAGKLMVDMYRKGKLGDLFLDKNHFKDEMTLGSSIQSGTVGK